MNGINIGFNSTTFAEVFTSPFSKITEVGIGTIVKFGAYFSSGVCIALSFYSSYHFYKLSRSAPNDLLSDPLKETHVKYLLGTTQGLSGDNLKATLDEAKTLLLSIEKKDRLSSNLLLSIALKYLELDSDESYKLALQLSSKEDFLQIAQELLKNPDFEKAKIGELLDKAFAIAADITGEITPKDKMTDLQFYLKLGKAYHSLSNSQTTGRGEEERKKCLERAQGLLSFDTPLMSLRGCCEIIKFNSETSKEEAKENYLTFINQLKDEELLLGQLVLARTFHDINSKNEMDAILSEPSISEFMNKNEALSEKELTILNEIVSEVSSKDSILPGFENFKEALSQRLLLTLSESYQKGSSTSRDFIKIAVALKHLGKKEEAQQAACQAMEKIKSRTAACTSVKEIYEEALKSRQLDCGSSSLSEEKFKKLASQLNDIINQPEIKIYADCFAKKNYDRITVYLALQEIQNQMITSLYENNSPDLEKFIQAYTFKLHQQIDPELKITNLKTIQQVSLTGDKLTELQEIQMKSSNFEHAIRRFAACLVLGEIQDKLSDCLNDQDFIDKAVSCLNSTRGNKTEKFEKKIYNFIPGLYEIIFPLEKNELKVSLKKKEQLDEIVVSTNNHRFDIRFSPLESLLRDGIQDFSSHLSEKIKGEANTNVRFSKSIENEVNQLATLYSQTLERTIQNLTIETSIKLKENIALSTSELSKGIEEDVKALALKLSTTLKEEVKDYAPQLHELVELFEETEMSSSLETTDTNEGTSKKSEALAIMKDLCSIHPETVFYASKAISKDEKERFVRAYILEVIRSKDTPSQYLNKLANYIRENPSTELTELFEKLIPIINTDLSFLERVNPTLKTKMLAEIYLKLDPNKYKEFIKKYQTTLKTSHIFTSVVFACMGVARTLLVVAPFFNTLAPIILTFDALNFATASILMLSRKRFSSQQKY